MRAYSIFLSMLFRLMTDPSNSYNAVIVALKKVNFLLNQRFLDFIISCGTLNTQNALFIETL